MSTATRTGRPAVGELIDVPGHGRCEVVSNADPSLVTIRTAHGTELRIGEQALRLALLAGAGAGAEAAQ